MPRIIPAPANIVVPDTYKLVPNKTIQEDHWLDLVLMHNLGQAMMHAQPVFNQHFDNKITGVTAGFVDLFEFTVPELSDKHLNLLVHVFGFSPAGAAGGQIRFTSLATGNTAFATLPAAPAVWVDGGAALDMTAAFPVLAYDTITVAYDGNVEIEIFQAEWEEIKPLGLYPGADDEMPAGVGIDNSYPLDTLEVAADRSVRSEFGETLINTGTDLAARVRVYSSFSVVSTNGVLTDRPYRVVVPFQDKGLGGHEIFWRMQVTPDPVVNKTHHIQFTGNATSADGLALHSSDDIALGFEEVVVPAAPAVTRWETGSFKLLPANILDAPGNYAGFCYLTVYPGQFLKSFTAWGT